MPFKISKNLIPTGDQPKAIKELVSGFKKNNKFQTLLGVTGSGKTFTMANVIDKLDKPTLIISHNKTLAAQLYEEFKAIFPQDRVHYFVSYYDYYQPEAYMPNSDTYIEKEVQINEEIDQMRHAAVQSILSGRNTIIIASVSCIYNLGSPETYKKLALDIKIGQSFSKRDFYKMLLSLQFERNEIDFWRGKFRQRGDYIDVWPPAQDILYRFKIETGKITEIIEMIAPFGKSKDIKSIKLFPAKFWLSDEEKREIAIINIEADLETQIINLQNQNKFIEAQRLKRRTEYDLALIREIGWCKGIENYSRYFEGREAGTAPFTLMDYFPKDYMLMIDESHMTIPQIRGMYNGDQARKATLIEHGFRLPSALDNRPMTYLEFSKKINKCLYVSATPSEYEINKSTIVAEQIVRPTFLLDPTIEVRKTENQIADVIKEIQIRIAKNERVIVAVMTKRLSEALAGHFKDKKIKTAFLHSEIDTLERPKILFDLRSGKYDVLVGINLLREGLDLPEVSLIIILDADKESFLRDKTSFMQISGRASRNLNGHVIMYADKITKSMKSAIDEMEKRRNIQSQYNKKHHTKPTQIFKDNKNTLSIEKIEEEQPKKEFTRDYIKELKQKLEIAQRNLQFEKAIELKNKIEAIKKRDR